MNRILFEKGEIGADGCVRLDDFRAAHILNVLHSEVGDVVRTGEVDGLVGTSEVVAIDGACVTLRASHADEAPPPAFDLILAPPRPRAMKRLLPQLASLGAGRIVLVGAQKVEKDFWGATLLKDEIYRPLLIDGLMQSGTAALPQLLVRRNFRNFLRDELDSLMPSPRRIVAHPYGAGTPAPHAASQERLTLAVGPEGGWTDHEVELLEERGFIRYSLGPRILRTDTALIALIARLAL